MTARVTGNDRERVTGDDGEKVTGNDGEKVTGNDSAGGGDDGVGGKCDRT